MLPIIFTWVLSGFIALFLGSLAEEFSQRFFLIKERWSLWIHFWTGLALLYLTLSLFSFFVPLNAGIRWILWLSMIGLSIIRKDLTIEIFTHFRNRIRRFHPAAFTLLFLTSGIGLLKSAGASEIFDEGAYHLPLIRMWEQKGLVIGMANLNAHYGLHSGWHLISAFCNPDFIPGFQSEFCLNGLLVVVLGLFAASRLNALLQQHFTDIRVSSIMAIFLPFLLFRNLLSSPSTDVPAIIGCWFFFLIWMEKTEQKNSFSNDWSLFLLLPAFLVILKASSAGILLVSASFLMLFFRQWSPKQRMLVIVLPLFTVLTWVFQNYLISGYAAFPLSSTAIGDPFWQVPLSSIQQKFYPEQFGAFAPPESYSLDWLKTWFLAHNPDSKLIILLSAGFFLLAPLLMPACQLRGKRWRTIYLLLLLLSGIWFFTITEPRYGFGPLVISALFLPACLLRFLLSRWPVFRFSLLIIIPLMAFNLMKTIREGDDWLSLILSTQQAPEVAFRKVACGNFFATCPQKYMSRVPIGKPPFCWDCPFPCMPLEGNQDSAFVFESKIAWFTTYNHHKQTKNPISP